MTYTQFETSPDSGAPVELFDFTLGASNFRYVNQERDFTFLGNVYTATPVSRSNIVSSFDSKDSQISVELPGDNVFARLFIGIVPASLPEVTIRQLHLTDPAQESIFVFRGFVSTVGFSGDLSKSSLACRPLTSGSGRIVPRYTFQGLCNHVLYDESCTIQESAFQENVTVESVSGRLLTVNAGQLSNEDLNRWTGGFIQFGTEFRQIVKQPAGRVMTLDLQFLNTPAGGTIRILPGCDYVINGDCLTIYNNVVNQAGFPYVPTKNPFEGLD